MNKKRSLIVRIIAIALCALMILGVVSAALSALAYDGTVPETGSNDHIIWFAVAIILAVGIIIALAVTKKKK